MKRILFLIILFASACSQHPSAEKVIFGKIWTGDDKQSVVEGIAINGDTIVATGSRSDIQQWVGEATTVTEVPEGGLIVPGFIDSHTHFVTGGLALLSIQLRDAKTKTEFINRFKEYAAKQTPGAWIMGGDWDHMNWGGELPTRDWIDSVTRNNPVWVNRLDGHMSLANTAAMKAAGLTDKVGDIAGGTVVRDKKGRATGVFKDNAQEWINPKVPELSEAIQNKALDTAMRYVASKGVTSTHNMYGYTKAFERAHDAGRMITRIYAVENLSDWSNVKSKVEQQGHGDKWLRYGGLKGFVDGSLGSHTAAFFKPFTDAPADSGFFITPEKDLYEWASAADKAGLQVMIHAIGDKAINTLLNIYERIEKENGPRDRRFRIEHAQHLSPADIERFKSLGVIASMQPYHAIDDGRWAEKVIGSERSKTTYAFGSLMKAGARVAFGSDWFVAPPTPLEGIYAAVTRRTLDDKNPDGWVPEEKITVAQALEAYTINAAYASFEEKIKGSLERGKLADLVVLDQDILTIAPEQIRGVKVKGTMVGGKWVGEW
ncbi:MAG TPA: amidohydrolase [Cyclobacteriaceae bacterium]|nr:amidohydrolase [Cyclobacteriaceae bacterium]